MASAEGNISTERPWVKEVPGLSIGTMLGHVGRAALLGGAIARCLVHPGRWWAAALAEVRRQAYSALPLVLFLTSLGAAVTSQQTGYQWVGNLPNWVIGSVVSASVISELAPLLTGIALVGIVGARIAAELGAMQVSQQIDALEVIGRDPVEFLVVPRVVAGFIVGPTLTALAVTVSIFAGWAVAVLATPVDSAGFWFGVRQYVWDFPFFFALIKGAAFGVAITFIASYFGLAARPSAGGVGEATTRAVVAMIAAILILDTGLAPLLAIAKA